MRYEHTHASKRDGSPAMLVAHDLHRPMNAIFVNEDGGMWSDRASAWQPVERDWEPFDDGPNNVERTTVLGHEVVVSLDDESVTGSGSYYWQIDGMRGVHDGLWFDGWSGSPEQSRKDAVEAAVLIGASL